MSDQPTSTTDPKAQQPTENAAGAGFSAVSGSEAVWWRPATVLPEAEDVLIVTNSPLAYYPGGDAADMGARGVAVGCHHDGAWKIWTGDDYQPAAVFWWMPFPSLPAPANQTNIMHENTTESTGAEAPRNSTRASGSALSWTPEERACADRVEAMLIERRERESPPVDNEHVAPGCQLFASQPVPNGWKFSDAERLNWMEKNYPRHAILGGSGEHVLWIVGYQFSGPTLRDALDNAIRETWLLVDADGKVPPV